MTVHIIVINTALHVPRDLEDHQDQLETLDLTEEGYKGGNIVMQMKITHTDHLTAGLGGAKRIWRKGWSTRRKGKHAT